MLHYQPQCAALYSRKDNSKARQAKDDYNSRTSKKFTARGRRDGETSQVLTTDEKLRTRGSRLNDYESSGHQTASAVEIQTPSRSIPILDSIKLLLLSGNG